MCSENKVLAAGVLILAGSVDNEWIVLFNGCIAGENLQYHIYSNLNLQYNIFKFHFSLDLVDHSAY